jgi:hypothetical protein
MIKICAACERGAELKRSLDMRRPTRVYTLETISDTPETSLSPALLETPAARLFSFSPFF